MGNTYRKEKSFDERRDNKPKKIHIADYQRKNNKNQRLIDVIYEDDDNIEYEDDYVDTVQYNTKK
jgi:hypothetical protein